MVLVIAYGGNIPLHHIVHVMHKQPKEGGIFLTICPPSPLIGWLQPGNIIVF